MIRFLFVLVLSSPLDKTLIASLLQAYSEYRQPLRVFFLSCACAAGAIHCIHCTHLTGTHRGSFSVLRLYLWTEYCLLLAPAYRHPQRFFLCPVPVPLDSTQHCLLLAPTYRHPQTFFLCPVPVPLDRTGPFTGPSPQAPTDVLSPSCACTF